MKRATAHSAVQHGTGIRLLRVIGDYAGGVSTTVGVVDAHLVETDAVDGISLVYFATKHTEAPPRTHAHVHHYPVSGHPKKLQLGGLWRMARQIHRICSRQGINVICVHSPDKPIGVVAMLMSLMWGIPLCLFYHGGRRHPTSSNVRSHVYALLPKLRSRMNFVVGDQGRRLMGNRARLIPPPISDTQMQQYSRDRALSESVDGSQALVLYPARFVRNKGQLDLVEAARQLQESAVELDFRVLLVGHHQDEDYIDCVRTRIAQYGLEDRVAIGDFLNQGEIFRLYQQCSLIVFPTYEEGFGRIIVEAGVAGVPTIAYRTGGVPDVIVHGRTGVLVDRGDADALAKWMATVLGDRELQSRLGRNAKVLYSEKYRADGIAGEFLRSLQEVAHGGVVEGRSGRERRMTAQDVQRSAVG